jgi:WD40 repeat protein
VIRMWELAASKDPVVLRGVPSTVRCATFMPDNRHIVAGYKDGRVMIWDVGE